MATFKVGQRVRFVSARPGSDVAVDLPYLIGREATIIRAVNDGIHDWVINVDLYSIPIDTKSSHLAPLTDPGADAFIEKIRQLKPLPVQEIA